MIYRTGVGRLRKINNRKCEGSPGDLSKIYFPWLSRPLENLGGLQPGLPLVSDVNVVAFRWYDRSSTASVVWVGREGQAVIAGYRSIFHRRRKRGGETSLCVHLGAPRPTVEIVATGKEGMKEEDDIFQIRLFLSTSLFQKSETAWCIMVTGCFELLRLLNGSSLPSPQNCFTVVLKLCLSH